MITQPVRAAPALPLRPTKPPCKRDRPIRWASLPCSLATPYPPAPSPVSFPDSRVSCTVQRVVSRAKLKSPLKLSAVIFLKFFPCVFLAFLLTEEFAQGDGVNEWLDLFIMMGWVLLLRVVHFGMIYNGILPYRHAMAVPADT